MTKRAANQVPADTTAIAGGGANLNGLLLGLLLLIGYPGARGRVC